MTAAARTALADAASSVDGVNVTPYFRGTAEQGEGMVRLEQIAYPDNLGGLVTWQVIVMISQDPAIAEKWVAAHLDQLVEALAEEMTILTAAPRQIQIPQPGSNVLLLLPCLVVEGLREH